MEEVIITEETAGQRIDKILTDITEFSRSTVQVMIKEGTITVNETTVKNNYKLKVDDVIVIEELEEREIDIVAEDLPIDIVYQDKDLLVINKTDKMVVHPGAGNPSGTLVNALLFHVKDLDAIKGEIRPGIVHRIDKETSGLLMVAKNAAALTNLSDQLKEKTATRKYIALVEGIIPHNLGKINAPIGRDPKNRQRMAVNQKGKDAVTNFKVLERFEEYTLIECQLETGRTHQIRVHLNYIQHPVVGDPKYGKRKTDTTHGQYLHAKTLGFVHPTTDKYMEFDSELPEYFEEMLETLRSENELKNL